MCRSAAQLSQRVIARRLLISRRRTALRATGRVLLESDTDRRCPDPTPQRRVAHREHRRDRGRAGRSCRRTARAGSSSIPRRSRRWTCRAPGCLRERLRRRCKAAAARSNSRASRRSTSRSSKRSRRSRPSAAVAEPRSRGSLRDAHRLGRPRCRCSRLHQARDAVGFLGRIAVTGLRSLRSPHHLRVAFDRAACLRDRHPGDPDRFADRLPDQRDHRLPRRAAAAPVRRGDLHGRPGGDRGAARDGRAADGDHRRRPLGQRVRGRDRRHAAQRRDRRAAVDGRRLLRSAGAAAAASAC